MSISGRIISAPRRLAFTLVELLVVMTIIVILIAVTLPSFSTMIESSNFTSAINSTTASLGSARAIAMQGNIETAVAFLFDARTERYTLMILEKTGRGDARLSDLPFPQSDTFADGFHPAPNTKIIELPKGTGVFGLSFAHVPNEPQLTMIDAQTFHWYAGEIHPAYEDDGTGSGNYVAVGGGILENPWIFPRNDPLLFWQKGVVPIPAGMDPEQVDEPWHQFLENGPSPETIAALRHSNSFMVEFSRDGSIVTAYTRSSSAQPANGYIEYPNRPIDIKSLDPAVKPYDSPGLFDPAFDPALANPPVIKPERNKEAILRTVTQVAVVDLKNLQRGTGISRVWTLHPSTSLAPWPDYDPDGRPMSGDEAPPTDPSLDALVSRVSRWIDLNAEIISFDRYTGSALRRISR